MSKYIIKEVFDKTSKPVNKLLLEKAVKKRKM